MGARTLHRPKVCMSKGMLQLMLNQETPHMNTSPLGAQHRLPAPYLGPRYAWAKACCSSRSMPLRCLCR